MEFITRSFVNLFQLLDCLAELVNTLLQMQNSLTNLLTLLFKVLHLPTISSFSLRWIHLVSVSALAVKFIPHLVKFILVREKYIAKTSTDIEFILGKRSIIVTRKLNSTYSVCRSRALEV